MVARIHAASFLFFDFLPVVFDVLDGADFHMAEDVRVTPDHFFFDGPHHIRPGKRSGLGRDFSDKQDLKKQIPQLFLKMPWIVFGQGVKHLIGFIQQIFADILLGLFPVPGAPVRRAQPFNQVNQVL